MPVGEFCNREVVIISPRESILDAARLMRLYHVGDLVVVEEPEGARLPVGILSDRDIVIEVLAQDVALNEVDVGDVMSRDLLTAGEDDELLDTVKQMKTHGVRRVPVVNESGALAGILTLDDVIELIAEELNDLVGLVTSGLRHEREYRAR